MNKTNIINMNKNLSNTFNTINLNDYIHYLTNDSKSIKTIKDYTTWINEFYKLYPTLSRENILSFKKSLQIKGNASSSINAKLSALKNYNEYLLSIGKVKSLFIISNDFIAIQKKGINPARYEVKDVEKVIKKISAKGSKRDLTIAYLMSNTGIRRSDVINAKLTAFDFESGIFKVVGGKGEKDRDIYLHEDLVTILLDYINTERKESKFANSKYLFITQRSPKMEENTVNKIIAKYGKINPHQFRHVWASNAYSNGMDLREIGNQLGHSSVITTNIYTNPTLKEMRKKMANVAIGF